MALIRCAACSEVVSSLVKTCPSCRLPMGPSHIQAIAAPSAALARAVAPRRTLPPVGRVSHFPNRT